MEYEALLKQALENMPSSVHERERFEIPKVKGRMEGNKTIIINLRQIAQLFHRPVEHLFKYLLRELACPGAMQRHGAIFGAKIPAAKINDKIKKYASELVLCKECGKPDTEFVKEGDVTNLKCQACAATYPVKARL